MVREARAESGNRGAESGSVRKEVSMRRLRSFFLLAALCAAAGAYGQAVTATPAPASSQRGFFPPTPGDDPSLFHTLPPEAYAQPRGAQQPVRPGAQAAPASTSAPVVVVVPDPNVESREQVERAQIEGQQAAARMRQVPAPINGAFTGATDEADRR